MKSWLLTSILLGIIVGAILPTRFAFAGEAEAPNYVPGPENSYTLEQPFGGVSSVKNIAAYIQLVYQFGLGIIGIMATVLIMFGGVKWISAAGNESIIGDAKEIIIAAVTGLTIALLSYIILLIINPQLVNISVSILKIPKAESCPIPTLVDITDGPGLKGHGAKTCPNLLNELNKVAASMSNPANAATYCKDCVIEVGNSYRDAKSQKKIYDNYLACVDQGYIKGDGTRIKAGSPPGGLGYCAKAAPTCDSNHVKGMAADLYFTVPDNMALMRALKSSELGDKTFNNGNSGGTVNYGSGGASCSSTKDPRMCQAQYKLYTVMLSGKFSNYDGEWWHFDLNKSVGCGDTVVATTCTTNATTGKADNAYCLTSASGSTPASYSYATCTNSASVCTSPASMVNPGTCGAATHNHFSITSATVVPACVAN